jgi:hypothetical protein
MNANRLVGASVIAAGLAFSALTAGLGTAAAQPQPCNQEFCRGQGDHGGPGDHPGGPPGGWDRGPGGPGGPGDHGPSPWDHNAQWGPPPPDQGWRGIDQGRFDHQPFNYNGNWVTPIFNPDFNNWGFWFLGMWIPL